MIPFITKVSGVSYSLVILSTGDLRLVWSIFSEEMVKNPAKINRINKQIEKTLNITAFQELLYPSPLLAIKVILVSPISRASTSFIAMFFLFDSESVVESMPEV